MISFTFEEDPIDDDYDFIVWISSVHPENLDINNPRDLKWLLWMNKKRNR